MTWQLTGPALEAFAVGGMLLGGGGGGDTADGAAGPPAAGVPVVDLTELPPSTPVCAVAQIGAPFIGRERIPSQELRDAVLALARATGIMPGALVALEIGGQNAMTAATAAAQTGLPLLDADLMGRALPRIDQTLLTLAGGDIGPIALASPSGHVVTVHRAGDGDREGLTRALLPSFGGRAAAALYPTTVGALRAAGTAGSVRRAVDLGQGLLAARASAAGTEPADAVTEHLGPLGLQVVARGDVRAVERSGERVVSTVVGPAGVVRLDADTEFHHCALDGRPVAGAPDVVGVLEARSLHPLLVIDLRPGDDVLVHRLPVAAPWYTRAGRELLQRGRLGVPA